MINLQNFQNSFLISWACRLISEENEEWLSFARDWLKPVGGINVFKSNIKYKDFKGIENIKSKYWRNVVQTWVESNSINDKIIRITDPINNNINLTFDEKPLFLEKTLKEI